MISSMTAFARTQGQGEWGLATWELKSVNHRYHEVNFRLPEALREQEPIFREALRKQFSRGKFDISLKFESSNGLSGEFDFNQALAEKLVGHLRNIQIIIEKAGENNLSKINPNDILSFPGVLSQNKCDMDEAKQAAIDIFGKLINKSLKCRQKEGSELKNIICQKSLEIRNQIGELKLLLPSMGKTYREKLLERLDNLNIEPDSTRLEQELAFILQKMDVTEEVDRLETHLNELDGVLDKGGVCGRRLDFLMQEMHREINTLGSKAVSADISKKVIDLKVLVEQIREQVQNVE